MEQSKSAVAAVRTGMEDTEEITSALVIAVDVEDEE
jgi:hypothetical protein